jgi:hypothetical protein
MDERAPGAAGQLGARGFLEWQHLERRGRGSESRLLAAIGEWRMKMTSGGSLNANQIIKLLSAMMLCGILIAFRSDVREIWLRPVLAILAFGILVWGIAQMFVKPK